VPRRSLDQYRDKRDPSRTPEPFGSAAEPGGGRQFVVQEHGARRLHWDLRLEIDGAMVSWAVPKGPSADPGEKRLAVQTEDHPLEYADFEGVIPAGNYGAGPMILWDRGSYRTWDGEAPSQALADGKIDVELFGHKLRGRWALVRLAKSDSGRDWLLIKKADVWAARDDLVKRFPCSVASGLTLAERRDPGPRLAALREAVRASGAAPAELRRTDLAPMLAATRGDAFDDDGWIFELKYDGVRALLARQADGTVRLSSRRGRDYLATFPEIGLVGRHLAAESFAIDGEIIAVEESGAGSFQLLQKRLGRLGRLAGEDRTSVRVVMYAFDLLHLDGLDLRPLPLLRRKELLRILLPAVGPVRYADHIAGAGVRLLAAARQRGLEGIVAKRATAAYRSGRRSPDWLKIKLPRHARLVVVGWSAGKGAVAARPIGSLLVAWSCGGALRYAGNVGSGLDEATAAQLLSRAESLRQPGPGFETAGIAIPRGAVFLRPALVARVRYTEVTESGALRQPVFEALEEDADWRDCLAPVEAADTATSNCFAIATPPAAKPDPRPALVNLDKIFWPEDGYTKGDLLAYYESIWPFLQHYLRDRPLVLTRYPDGIHGKSFFQKHAPDFLPDWIETCRIDDTDYIVCNDLPALLYVINLGCIPLHIWSARRDRIERPDWLILDLDPKDAPFAAVVAVARHLRQLLRDLDLPHYVKTSGQAGLHVLLPLGGRMDHSQAKILAEVLARVAAAELPEIATVARPLRDRAGRVYIDFLQNGRGKTIAAPFCVRPVAGAPVSMPLRWTQVTARLDPRRFTIRTAPRLMRDAADPLAPILADPVDEATLAGAVSRLQSRLLGSAGQQ
jgi:bifunctional non-homologous end joining protein LigD